MKILWIGCLLIAPLSILAGDAPKWLDNLKLSGDFRTRVEITDYDARKDRQRYRIRLRLNASWQLNENWLVGTRVVTGNPDDQRTIHQTLDNGFKEFEISLDRAYLQYKTQGITARFGKFAHPFKALGIYNEILWDADVQPEGMALHYKGDYFYAATSYYILDERANDTDISMVTGQVGGQSGGRFPAAWGIAYYGLDDLEGTLETEFTLIEAQASIGFQLGDAKGRVALQYMTNTDAATDEDTGTVLGFEVKRKGFFTKTYLQYQRIEDEAVFDYLAGDDFTASSNFEGFVAGMIFPIWKTISLHTWALTADPIVGDGSADRRYRLDINAKF